MSDIKPRSLKEMGEFVRNALKQRDWSTGEVFEFEDQNFRVRGIYLDWFDGEQLHDNWLFEGGDLHFLLKIGGPFVRATFLRWDTAQGLIWAELKHRYRRNRLIRELELISTNEYQVAFRPDQLKALSSSLHIIQKPAYLLRSAKQAESSRKRKDLIKTLDFRLPKLLKDLQLALHPSIPLMAWEKRPFSLSSCVEDTLRLLEVAPGAVTLLLQGLTTEQRERVVAELEAQGFDLEKDAEAATLHNYEPELKRWKSISCIG